MTRFLVPGAAILAACGSPATSAYVEADSAGVQTITYTRMPGVPTLVPDSATLVGLGDNPEFERVGGAAFFPDGNILVADAVGARVLLYSGTGTLFWSLGRPGAGPLEFRNLALARPLGVDSIVTYDRDLKRVMVFDTAGRTVRSVTLAPAGDGGSPEAIGLLADSGGSILVRIEKAGVSREVPAGIHPLPVALWRYGRNGKPTGPILEGLAGPEWVKIESPPTILPRPYRDGVLVAATATRIHVADPATATIRTYGLGGGLIRRVVLPIRPAPMSADRIAAWREEQLEPVRRSGDAERLAETTRLLDQVPLPERLPGFRRLFVTADDRLWLEEYPAPGSARQRYLVLDTAGLIVGRAEAPERAMVYDARGELVLVRWRDSTDRDHVRVHRLEPKQ